MENKKREKFAWVNCMYAYELLLPILNSSAYSELATRHKPLTKVLGSGKCAKCLSTLAVNEADFYKSSKHFTF
jgi:hypothetical protein